MEKTEKHKPTLTPKIKNMVFFLEYKIVKHLEDLSPLVFYAVSKGKFGEV
jgi:hypothetical protein